MKSTFISLLIIRKSIRHLHIINYAHNWHRILYTWQFR